MGRYNINLADASSVYVIVGLIGGARLTGWNGDTPPSSVPVGGESGAQAECNFLSDSLAYGRSLGKTIFIYVTHWFQKGCNDWSLIQQIDVWIYGHDHAMWQSPPLSDDGALAEIKQEQRYYPVRFLVGNGGFDSNETPVVSFVHITEELTENRSRLTFSVFDTCKATKANSWKTCDEATVGKASPSFFNFGFIYNAPRMDHNREGTELPSTVLIQIDDSWVVAKACPKGLLKPHKERRCLMKADAKDRATIFHLYDATANSMRLAVEGWAHAPAVQEDDVLVEKYGFYDMSKYPVGAGQMSPEDGFVVMMDMAGTSSEPFILKNLEWRGDLLHVVTLSNSSMRLVSPTGVPSENGTCNVCPTAPPPPYPAPHARRCLAPHDWLLSESPVPVLIVGFTIVFISVCAVWFICKKLCRRREHTDVSEEVSK